VKSRIKDLIKYRRHGVKKIAGLRPSCLRYPEILWICCFYAAHSL